MNYTLLHFLTKQRIAVGLCIFLAISTLTPLVQGQGFSPWSALQLAIIAVLLWCIVGTVSQEKISLDEADQATISIDWQQQMRWLQETIDELEDGLVIFTPQDCVLMHNQAYLKIYPHLADTSLLGVRFEDLLRDNLAKNHLVLDEQKTELWLRDRLRKHQNPQHPFMIVLESGTHVRVHERRLEGGAYACVHSNRTELVQLEKRMQAMVERLGKLSTSDVLTQINNRRYFEVTAPTEWLRAMRYSQPISLALIDIDHFKLYNDHYGHSSGDSTLHAVAQALHSGVFRAGEFVCRYGGEEFVVVMPNANLESATVVVERVLNKVRDLKITHEHSKTAPHVTISVGLACTVPKAGNEITSLVQAADSCLYQAKDQGRDRYTSTTITLQARRAES